MGLHSSSGRALRANAVAVGSNPVEDLKIFYSGKKLEMLNMHCNCDDHISVSSLYLKFKLTSFHYPNTDQLA